MLNNRSTISSIEKTLVYGRHRIGVLLLSKAAELSEQRVTLIYNSRRPRELQCNM